MATKKKEVKLRESWQAIFNILKAQAPALFGSKVFADVSFIGADPDDATFMIIEFNEEDDV